MKPALTSLLLTHTPLTNLVGRRIHWNRRPGAQRTFPYLSLSRISGQKSYTLDGQASLSAARVQIDIWAEKASDVLAIEEVLTAHLSGFSGVSKTKKLTIFQDGERDLDGDAPDGQRPLFGTALDFIVNARPK